MISRLAQGRAQFKQALAQAVSPGLSATLPAEFTLLLLAYLSASTLHSMWIKRKVIADVLTQAGLYTLRVLAGGAAVGVVASEWLLAFSVFLFLSLAFV